MQKIAGVCRELLEYAEDTELAFQHSHCREDAERARSGVKKIEGRVVQIVFADKRPLKNVRNQREKKQSETADDELLELVA